MARQIDPAALHPLLFRPQLSVGDGPRGFLRKVADQNGLTLQFLFKGGVTFERACLQRLGCTHAIGDSDELDAYAGAITESLKRFPEAWLNGRSRFCPDCLRASSQWRINWEVMFADACTQHSTWLLDRCDCGRALDWNRPLLLQCRCGRLLTSLRGVACPGAIRELSQSLVLAAIGHVNPNAITPIQGLDLGALQRVVLLLGHYSSLRIQVPSRKRVRTSSMEGSWNISSTAAAICEGWPQSFTRVLDRHSAAARGTSAEGRLPGTFGALYQLLYRGRLREFEAIRVLFEHYLAEHWRGALGRRNTRLAADTLKRAAWQPIGKVANQLGVAPAVALKRLERSGAAIVCRTSAGGRSFVVATKGHFAVETVSPPTHLTLVEAAKALGLSKRRVRDLAKAQVLPASRTGGFNSAWSMDRSHLAEMLDIMMDAPVVHDGLHRAVSLGHVLRYWACSNALARELIAALIAGKLPVLGRLPMSPGFSGLLLDAEHVRRLRDDFVHQRLSERMTVPDVSVHLGVKQEVTYHLVRRGLLKSSMARLGASRSQAVVTAAAIQAFRTHYGFARDIARTCECSPRALVVGLRTLGIEPVAGPRADGCRQTVFLINDALTRSLEKFRDCHLGAKRGQSR